MPQAPARRDASESSDVLALVRMHHRRRGWAWVAVGSLIGLSVYVGVGADLFDDLNGTVGTLSLIPLFVLLALLLFGLVAVIVDTVRIRRADASVRVSAKGQVSHHPLYAQAHRYPPRHHASWVFGIFMLVAMTGITVAILPAEVNSWAYVTGAAHKDTFNPMSYTQTCSVRHGCSTVTHGYLSNNGAPVAWGSQVPLGQPFTVRDPLWAWGTGRSLISSDGTAIEVIIGGLFFNGVTILLVYAFVVMIRYVPPSRRQRTAVRSGHRQARRRR